MMISFLIYAVVAIFLAILVQSRSQRAVTSLLYNKDFWMLQIPALGLYLLTLFMRNAA